MMSNRRKIKRTADPRNLGGKIIGPGGPHDQAGVVLDTRNAILLRECVVSTLDFEETGNSVIAMALSGRINRTQDHAEVMFLFGTDGAAAIITELMALLGRATGVDSTALLEDIFERISKLREDGNLT
jgi:hypothetical protein